MSAKVSYRDRGLLEITGALARAGSTRLRVGLIGPLAAEPHGSERARAHSLSVAQVGILSEYGSSRAGVPRRPFMAPVMREQTQHIRDAFASAARKIIFREKTSDAELGKLGQLLAGIMRDRILRDENDVPRNAARTSREKGFDHPLYHSGQLAAALSWDIVRGAPLSIAGVARGILGGLVSAATTAINALASVQEDE